MLIQTSNEPTVGIPEIHQKIWDSLKLSLFKKNFNLIYYLKTDDVYETKLVLKIKLNEMSQNSVL